MSGVEILASEQVVAKYGISNATIYTMLIIIGIAIFLGVLESIKRHDWNHLLFYMFVGVCVSLLIGSTVQEETKKPLEYETQYKLIISDKVLMNEFYDKYEIIEQEGRIFTVRKREAE